MGSSLYLHMFIVFCCCDLNVFTKAYSSKQPLCHEDERSALLQFRHSFVIDEFASVNPFAYAKVESWKLDGNTSDCCSWDGVECSHKSGRVIGLNLNSSFLYGSIKSNSSLFNLVHLRRLNLANNHFNYSPIPTRIGNLSRLRSLNLYNSFFSGQIPSGVCSLSKLTSLDLSVTESTENLLKLENPSLRDLAQNLTNLKVLVLDGVIVDDVLPQSLANLTQLSWLGLRNTELLGEIPSWLQNVTRLTVLKLSHNHLHGTFPSSISQLKHLEVLILQFNSLSGKVELDIFQNLPNLVVLLLGRNKLTVLLKNSTIATLPKFCCIGLASCNLKEFPDFLRFQDELEFLDLADNSIHGLIPTWLWDKNKPKISYIDLNGNFLTEFEQHQDAIPWASLLHIDFSFNRLQGPVPLPPPSILSYKVAGNFLTGEIPTSFCQNSALFMLDLSDNYLSGAIPQCLLSSSSDSLSMLNLSRNKFEGTIPQTFVKVIKMIDLSHNQLHGGIPRSLATCTMLQILVLGDNQIEDTFPYWLGTLPELQILVLRSNRFYGPIENPKTNLKFPKLRIIDLSHNGFFGTLPSEYFKYWNAMKEVAKGNFSTYMHVDMKERSVMTGKYWYADSFSYAVTISIKGTERFYEKIQIVFVVVDLSNNKFSGEIPESLGNLSGLQVFNISKNNLTGTISSHLAKLTNLESLDLSQNMLSGEIPQQLTQLTFLSILNVSHNRLTGPIPRGKQFGTFDNTSYGGNMGLCGVPLTMLCGNSETSPPPPPARNSQGDDSEFSRGIYWMVITIGYGGGLIVGLVIGHILTTRYHERFVAIFERKKKTQKKQKR